MKFKITQINLKQWVSYFVLKIMSINHLNKELINHKFKKIVSILIDFSRHNLHNRKLSSPSQSISFKIDCDIDFQ